MKRYQLTVNVPPISATGILSGDSDAQIAKQFKDEVARRAGLMKGGVIRMMSDEKFWQEVVTAHNRKFAASEPLPRCARDLIEFGLRAGYLEAVSG